MKYFPIIFAFIVSVLGLGCNDDHNSTGPDRDTTITIRVIDELGLPLKNAEVVGRGLNYYPNSSRSAYYYSSFSTDYSGRVVLPDYSINFMSAIAHDNYLPIFPLLFRDEEYTLTPAIRKFVQLREAAGANPIFHDEFIYTINQSDSRTIRIYRLNGELVEYVSSFLVSDPITSIKISDNDIMWLSLEDEGLHAINIEDPYMPELKFEIPHYGYILLLAASDSLICFKDYGSDHAYVFQYDDEGNYEFNCEIPIENNYPVATIIDNKLFLVDSQVMQCYDLSIKDSPQLLLNRSGNFYSATIKDHLLTVTMPSRGYDNRKYDIYDISVPEDPELLKQPTFDNEGAFINLDFFICQGQITFPNYIHYKVLSYIALYQQLESNQSFEMVGFILTNYYSGNEFVTQMPYVILDDYIWKITE